MQTYRLLPFALTLLAAPALAFNAVLPEAAPAQEVVADAAGGPPFDLTDKARVAAGKARYQSGCADFCHGHQPALFIDRQGLDPDYVYNTIREGGRGATPMPPWGDVFSPEEIWELVAYLKSLGQW
ncbi:c-type cytochrome [Parazoarcus communis]|uniref:Cytochrome c n=1 Tax=Parazoarcus communis SWub3 = DSM 12120 TaxID=1121029 RepID=A0A323UZ18_9RHOO|nr:cytochrome c [Parazoarcus communis]NMG68678.1 cytochrome c [Parazoarcus communis SWub3 = DSM 12120]PZA17809.1 cytochrome c [Azoarcus communis] [Parazoarcus communis SWub3 = DSM 12120]